MSDPVIVSVHLETNDKIKTDTKKEIFNVKNF